MFQKSLCWFRLTVPAVLFICIYSGNAQIPDNKVSGTRGVIPIALVNVTRPGLKEVLQGGRKIRISFLSSPQSNINGYEGVPELVLGRHIRKNLIRNGYFQFVEKPASVVSDANKPLPKEIADVILFVQLTSPLESECVRVGCFMKWEAKNFSFSPYSPYIKVNARARLVNVETGRSINFTTRTVYKTSVECKYVGNLVPKALSVAAGSLAGSLSPQVRLISIQTKSDVRDLPSGQRALVGQLLIKGNKALSHKPPNYEKAAEFWKQAAALSGNQSSSAAWNLAVYFWWQDETEDAKEQFDRFLTLRGPRLSYDDMKYISQFDKEMTRRSLDRNK